MQRREFCKLAAVAAAAKALPTGAQKNDAAPARAVSSSPAKTTRSSAPRLPIAEFFMNCKMDNSSASI